MKLFKITKIDDYGTDYWFQIFYSKNWALLQTSISWYEYPDWPLIQIKSGHGYIFSFLFSFYKFGLGIDLMSRTWCSFFDD